MTFQEDWFPASSQRVLGRLAVGVRDVDGLIVEIGSWEGRSTIVLAHAVAPRVVHAVDTWRGSPSDVSAQLAADRDVFARFLDNTAGLNVQAHRQDWRDYIAAVDEPIALCFIDAEHTFDEVCTTVAAVRPLMAAGGIICGDDHDHPPVREATFAAFDRSEVKADGVVWWWSA